MTVMRTDGRTTYNPRRGRITFVSHFIFLHRSRDVLLITLFLFFNAFNWSFFGVLLFFIYFLLLKLPFMILLSPRFAYVVLFSIVSSFPSHRFFFSQYVSSPDRFLPLWLLLFLFLINVVIIIGVIFNCSYYSRYCFHHFVSFYFLLHCASWRLRLNSLLKRLFFSLYTFFSYVFLYILFKTFFVIHIFKTLL